MSGVPEAAASRMASYDIYLKSFVSECVLLLLFVGGICVVAGGVARPECKGLGECHLVFLEERTWFGSRWRSHDDTACGSRMRRWRGRGRAHSSGAGGTTISVRLLSVCLDVAVGGG